MSLPTTILEADDLAERLARLSERLIDAASEEEIFETIGAEFSLTVWGIEGPALRERYIGWKDELEGIVTFQEGALSLPLDFEAIPPHFFASRRFRPVPESTLAEIVLRAMRSGEGRSLQEDEIQAAIRRSPKISGVFGPLFVSGAPWGLMAIRWRDPNEEALDLFTLFGSQVGAALQLIGTRVGFIRAERALRAARAQAREEASPALASSFLGILESATALTESDTASLFLIDEETGAFRVAGHFGASCEWTKGNVLRRDEHFDQVMASLEPLVVERLRPEQPWIALLPLIVEARPLGLLLIARQPEGRPFAFQEVTRARLLAAQLAALFDNAQLLGQTRRQNELLDGLYRLSRLLSQTPGSEPPLQRALEFLVEKGDYLSASIYVLEGKELVRRAGVGPVDGPARLAPEDDHPFAQALDGTTASSSYCEGRPYVVFPLEASKRVVGCLAAVREPGQDFHDPHLELLESYCAQIALAIEHGRLRGLEQDRVRQLRYLSEVGQIATNGRLDRHKLLSDFLQVTASTLGYDAAIGLFPAEEGDEEIVLGGELPEPVEVQMRRLINSVRASRCDVREATVAWGESRFHIGAMPARSPAGDQALFAFARRAFPTTLQEFATLSTAGSTLGFALEDAARFARAQRSINEMKLLLDLGQAVTSTADPDELLGTTARRVNDLLGATRTMIFLFDEANNELRCAALSSEKGAPVRRGQTVAKGREYLARKLGTIERRSEAPPDLRPSYEEAGIHSSLTVLMKIMDEPIGCIWIVDESRPRRWAPETIERVEIIAHQVAIGLANLRLHADLRASNQELARAQDELIKKERLVALGELAAVVAHEVRNPLGVIFNSMSSLDRIIQPEGDVKTLLEIVAEEANRLDRIVGDLLDFSRPNHIEPGWSDLGAMLADLVSTLPQAPEIDLDLEVDPELPEVYVDARLMRQAIVNLMQNGMQAMPKGGKLGIGLRRMQRGEKNFVAISVKDQGAGIPEELSAKILEPFFTTKATGSGLGLALVQRIVEAHRGTLALDSTLGQGSEFTIELEVTERQE